MSRGINIASIGITDEAYYARNSMFNKVNWKKSASTSILGIPKQVDHKVVANSTAVGIEQFQLFTLNLSSQGFNESFNNSTLEQLRNKYNIPDFNSQGKWIADIVEEHGRITIQNVKVSQDGEHHPHEHPVFEKVEFRDIIVTLDIEGIEVKLYLDENSANFSHIQPMLLKREVGFEGEIGKNKGYQIGIKQSLIYVFQCADSLINVGIDFSFVFMYPSNDFEPTGVIDANKIFPQIQFYSKKINLDSYPTWDVSNVHKIDVPAGKNGNKIKIKKYNARVKLTCNNNSFEHISINDDGRDAKYFDKLPIDAIPPQFDRLFNIANYDLLRNIVGLYTDSNFGTTTKYGTYDFLRDKPSFPFEVIPIDLIPAGYSKLVPKNIEPAAFWSNIFDYARYNLVNETEFIAVHGIQGDRFNVNSSKFSKTKAPYLYPREQFTKQITILKEPRQASYDNIHLHGYLGHYADNYQPVIHAPICGYCCFHMHWRWSKLNVDLASNGPLRYGTTGWTYLCDDGKKYMGWHTNTNDILMQQPFKEPGMPLIPYEQQLKIAITDPDVKPYNEESNVTPTNNITLNLNRKSVWYCVDIINLDYGYPNNHLVMEQGCGYAFDYSDDGKASRKAALGRCFLPRLFREICEVHMGIDPNEYGTFLNYVYDDSSVWPETQLEPNEFYEMQYRIMRLFNELNPDTPSGRRFLNQVPGINEDPYASGDQNTKEHLQAIFDLIVNQ